MDKSSLVPRPSSPAEGSELQVPATDSPLAPDWRTGDNFAPGVASTRYGTDENDSGFDLQQIISLVKRRWPIMLGTFGAALALGFIYIHTAKPIYSATATLEMNTDATPDIGGDVPGLSEFMESKQSGSIDTQIEILRAGPIYSSAVKKLTPAQHDLMHGYAPMIVDQVNSSNLLSVTVRSYSPEVAAAVANNVCSQYIHNSREKNKDNSLGAIKYIDDQITSNQNQLNDKEGRLRDFKQRTGIFSITDQASALSTNLAGIRTALQQTTADRASTAARLQASKTMLAAIPLSRVVPNGLVVNPDVTAMQTQLTQYEIDRASALEEFTPTSFKVKALDAQIAATRARMLKSARTIVSAWSPDPVRGPLTQTIATNQADVWAADARINALRQQLASAQKILGQLPSQEMAFTQLTTDVTVLQQTYQLLVQKRQSLRIGAEGSTADASLAYPAGVPGSPIAPDKHRVWIFSALLGFLAAVALAMLVDALDNRIYNDADALRATSLPVLAHIPYIKNSAEQSLMLTGDKVTPLLESFRMLRANIAFSVTDKPIRAIVVTSSVPNEGKSNSALNLAIATALGGERTVLIDLDLRRPTQHKLSKLSNAVGFTNVISGQATLEEALQETHTPGLRILTSGPVPPNPFRLLNSQSARQTILKVIETADFVVVDTPPMLGLADARLISSLVDGTLMIISCQETGRREAGRASDLLIQTGNEILGTVLTKVPASSDSYGYYQYQQYGRYFDEENEDDESNDGTLALESGKNGNGKRRKVKSS